MKWERLILITFLGNYLINNVAAAIVALLPASESSSYFTAQYIGFVVLGAISSALLTWWFFKTVSKVEAFKWGIIFGIGGFLISIITTFVSGITSVLAQSGSLSQVGAVLPNFGPFLWNWSTLVLLAYWLIPAALVGWYLQKKTQKKMGAAPTHA